MVTPPSSSSSRVFKSQRSKLFLDNNSDIKFDNIIQKKSNISNQTTSSTHTHKTRIPDNNSLLTPYRSNATPLDASNQTEFGSDTGKKLELKLQSLKQKMDKHKNNTYLSHSTDNTIFFLTSSPKSRGL